MKPGTLTFKDASVRALDLTVEILEALAPITKVFREFRLPVVVTSLNDAKHRINSLHYSGRAVDLRSKHVPDSQKGDLLAALQSALDDRYDVLLEDRGGMNEHFHIEYDPKP